MEAQKASRRRFRFSLRTLFVVVTVICMLFPAWFWVHRRQQEFLQLMRDHSAESGGMVWFASEVPLAEDTKRPFQDYYKQYQEYHKVLGEKYAAAAKYPWWDVEPDPPAPEMPLKPKTPVFYVGTHPPRHREWIELFPNALEPNLPPADAWP